MVTLIDIEVAEAHLRAADPVMAALIARHAPFAMREAADAPFLALSRAIAYQQLSGKAAATIFGRYLEPGVTPIPASSRPSGVTTPAASAGTAQSVAPPSPIVAKER